MDQKRIGRIMEHLKTYDINQILVSDPYSIFYITGDLVHPGERFMGLLLREGQEAKLILNKLFTSPKVDEKNIVYYDDTSRGALEVIPFVDRKRPLGIDKRLAAEFLLELQENGAAAGYVNASPCVDRVRMRKDFDEICRMERASKMNDEAMRRIKAEVHAGITEYELKEKLAKIYRDLGAEGVSFPSIVSFGANASDPHHMPDGTVLEYGDCVLFDIGCKKEHYCSDMTRTYYFGTVSEKDREIYEITKRANLTAESMIKPGVRFCDIDAAARKIIEDAGYGVNFTHRLGHCIGLQDHEWGDVGSKNTDTVEEGMIFSCEPGIYIPGKTGVRIEDLCLVTSNGVKILNSVSKDIEVIPAK